MLLRDRNRHTRSRWSKDLTSLANLDRETGMHLGRSVPLSEEKRIVTFFQLSCSLNGMAMLPLGTASDWSTPLVL